MTRRARKMAIAFPEDSALIERPGPGLAPTAFRIWAAGENRSDDGSIYFTEESARLLLGEQSDRGRIYPFDFDHLSLLSDRPATAGRASGWHTLEVRKDAQGRSELWAVNCDWCQDVRAGLEAQPPYWRFYSPAFYTNAEAEVVGYTNCAICINPLTHDLPSLASKRVAAVTASPGDTCMDKKALMAALATLADGEASDEAKKEALAALAAHLDAEGEDDKDKDDEEKKPEADAEGEDDKDKDKAPEQSAQKTHAASIRLARENVQLKARVDAIEIRDLLAQRPDLSPTVRAWAETQPLAVVKSFVALSAAEVARETSPTRPDTKATDSGFVAPELGTHPIDKVFGIRPANTGAIGFGGLNREIGVRVLHSATPSEARRLAAKKGA